MEAQFKDPTEEIKRLQRCINDLVSVQALPAAWSRSEPSQIVPSLLGALVRLLPLDLVYVRLNGPVGEIPIEQIRVGPTWGPALRLSEISEMLRQRLGDDLQKWPLGVRHPLGGQDLSLVPLQLGIHAEIGVMVAGSQRADFPQQTEKLVLSAAANLGATVLHEAQLRSEQRRITRELDQRVAQRTAELSRANAELLKEISDRRLIEDRLRQEERALRHSEARKAAILESVLDCIITIDHEGLITEFNPAAERTFGYHRNEVVGRRLADVVIPASLRERHRSGLARYLTTGESHVLGSRIEMTAMRSDGSEFPVELVITRIPQDGPPSFTGYLCDITDRKRNEDALREAHARAARSEERWRSVFENAAVGVALTDLNGRFVAANPVFQRMLGYGQEELHALSFLAITSEEYVETNRALVGELLAGERRDFQIEEQYRRKDGGLIWVRNNVSLVPGSEGEPRFLMAIVEDVSDRKRAEEALAKAESELANAAKITSLGVLTASIAHEINQPLSGIVTNASTCLRMLASEPPNIDGARETARRTIRDANRASEVITRLRALFGKKAIITELLDLNEATREVIAVLMSELQRNRVVLRQEFADDLPRVKGDRVQLQQVIFNLLRNASDAMNTIEDRPRQLLMRTERDEEDRVRLTVQDAGVGFDPQSVDRLFDPFHTTKSDGMGIGLSVSRSIIEGHHGHLWATLNDGPGATFAFSIPCEA
jgi:PAS domain S-box-containing protein